MSETTRTPMGQQQFYVFPTEPDPALMDGTVRVFQGRDQDDVLVVVSVRFDRFGGRFNFQLADQGGRIPAQWLTDENDPECGEEWRTQVYRVVVDEHGNQRAGFYPATWGDAVAAGHAWARFLMSSRVEVGD